MRRFMIVAAAVAASLLSTTAYAKKCDGFHGCRCGVTAARNFGLNYSMQPGRPGHDLKEAATWRAFQHTGFSVGVAAIKPNGHHVAKVTGGSSCADATITDESGTYHRNVCGWTFVNPGAPGSQTVTASAHSHRYRGGRRYRTVSYGAPQADRLTASY